MSEAEQYRHGRCYPMAVALHRQTGWNIGCLMSYRSPHDKGKKPPHIVHAWVIDPKNGFTDGAGTFAENELKPMFEIEDDAWTEIRTFNETGFFQQLKESADTYDEWFTEMFLPRFNRDIEQATEFAKENLSHLWKTDHAKPKM